MEAPTNQSKSNRELLAERLSVKYPDKEYEDDESLFGQIGEDYDDYEQQLGTYKERDGKLAELLARDPRSAQFISNMAKGNDPWLAMIERWGIDGITDILNNPERKEEFAEANRKFVESIANEKRLEEEYNANFAESMATLQQMQREQGLSDEMVDAAMEHIMGIVSDAILGKFSRETIENALHSINRDSDIENARSEGEIAGRNARIEERLRRYDAGDGLPNIGGTNANDYTGGNKLNIFDYADAAK